MKTCNDCAYYIGTHISPLSDRQTTIDVISYDRLCRRHFLSITYITILEAFPVGLPCTDSPVETWVELTFLRALFLEEVVEPWRSREVSPSTVVTRAEVRLDSVTLSSVR